MWSYIQLLSVTELRACLANLRQAEDVPTVTRGFVHMAIALLIAHAYARDIWRWAAFGASFRVK